MLKKHYPFWILMGLLAYTHSTFGQALTQEKIISGFETVRNKFPREKVYVHLDRSVYHVQDTIWYKAYLIDNITQSHSSISEVVHIELIDRSGKVVYKQSLQTKLGLAWSAIALNSQSYLPGNYVFRAYTRWMMNFGDEFFFSKIITIVPNQKLTKTTDAPTTHTAKGIDIQFLPEGGSLVSGLSQRVAFKAINKEGYGITISGGIFNSKNEKITEIKSNSKGMGYFEIKPEFGETYWFKTTDNQIQLQATLPKVIKEGTALSVNPNYTADSIEVLLSSTLPDRKLFILGQSKGSLSFVASVITNTKGRKVLRVGKNVFLPGVSQVLVLNDKEEVIHARSFFLSPTDWIKISLASSKTTFKTFDSIPVKLHVSDTLGLAVLGSFSVAVTDDSLVKKDPRNDENILTYLLLTSDLKGNIEDPGYYFDNINPQKTEDLDMLMLTQGWVNYNWKISDSPRFAPEKEFSISGIVNNITGKAVTGAKVTLVSQDRLALVRDTLTNDKGEFLFKNLPVLDSTTFFIQAKNANNKNGTLSIDVEKQISPPYRPSPVPSARFRSYTDSISEKFVQAKNTFNSGHNNSGIALKDVNITGKKIVRGSRNLNGPGEASQTLTNADLAPLANNTLYEILIKKIRGFRDGLRKNGLIKDFYIHTSLARFSIDGQSIDLFFDPTGKTLGYSSPNMAEEHPEGPYDYQQYVMGYLGYFKAEDISGIEIMENSYGFSYNGKFASPTGTMPYTFIEITTKSSKGLFFKKTGNVELLGPINYGNNKTFYQPKYHIKDREKIPPYFRPTLYWNPNLISTKEGAIDFSFLSSSRKGKYTLWIEGLDLAGRMGMRTISFSIE